MSAEDVDRLLESPIRRKKSVPHLTPISSPQKEPQVEEKLEVIELSSEPQPEKEKEEKHVTFSENETGNDEDDMDVTTKCVCGYMIRICSPFHEVGPLVEMIMYAVFLTLFLLCVSFRKKPDSFNYIQVQSARWGNTDPAFVDIDSEVAFWEYLQGPFLDGLEFDINPNGEPKKQPFSGSYMIGNVVVRQKRVKMDTCKDHTILQNVTRRCHLSFEESRESKQTYGNGAFHWSPDPQEDINSKLFNPQAAYGLGGFYATFVLPLNRTNANTLLGVLSEDGYIDEQTRLISVERALYEPNSQLVLGLQQELEFDHLGGIVAKENYRVARILQYETSEEKFYLILELAFVYMVVYYILQELTELYDQGFKYFQNAWNLIDCVNLLLFLLVFYIRYSVDTAASELRDRIRTDTFVNFQCLLYSFNLTSYSNAFNAVLCFLKIFKYLAVSPKLGMLNQVFSVAAGDLLSWLFMFMVVMFGFTMAFYMAFGNNIEGYSNLFSSAVSLFAWALGDFDHGELQEQNFYLGSALFIFYSVLMMIMLLNFAIAIVSNAFDEVNENIKDQSDDNEFNNEIRAAIHGLTSIFRKVLPKRFRKKSILPTYAMTPELEKMETVASESELGNTLGDHEKAKKIFERFDMDGNGCLDKEETELMKRAVFEKERREDKQFLSRRLDAMEDGIHRLERLILQMSDVQPHPMSPPRPTSPSYRGRQDLKDLKQGLSSKDRKSEFSI